MGGLVEVADRVVAPVYRQGVLDQVVGADGDEVYRFEQAGDGQCGGGDFYHAACRYFAEGFAAFGQLAAGGVQVGQALFEFGNGRNHRPHHFYRPVGGGAQDGAHLGAEHDGFGQAQADAGQPKCGVQAAVGRAVLAEPARVFVHAQVHGADGQRFAFHFFHDVGVYAVLFFFVGQGVAVQIEVFAAEEAHAVGAEFVQGFDVFGVFDVGIEFDLGAVFGGGGGVFQFVQFALFAFVGAQFAAVFGKYDVVGVDDEYAVDAVDNHPFVFADELAGVAQADDGRDVQAASQDGGVAGGAARVGYEGGNALFFQVDGVGGREVVGDEYGVVEQVGIKVEFVARTGQVVVDAFDHLQHVLFAGAQVFVVNRVELLAQAVGLDF